MCLLSSLFLEPLVETVCQDNPDNRQSNIYVYLYMCIFIYLSIHLSIYLSIYLSVCLSIYLSINLSIYLYIHIYIYTHIYNIYIYIYIIYMQLRKQYVLPVITTSPHHNSCTWANDVNPYIMYNHRSCAQVHELP